MDANQRSEINNQTDNNANEKWTPGSTGASGENGQPLDHTYPQGLGVQQQGNQQRDIMGTQQSGAGPGAGGSGLPSGGMGGRSGDDSGIPGGSMETQINGGSGAVQGITDSHQRQMEQKSAAYGELELPVGKRPKDEGVHLSQQRGSPGPHGGNLNTQGGGMAGPQSSRFPSAASGSMGNRQSAGPSSTSGGGMPGPQAGAAAPHSSQEAQRGNMQQGVAGSHAGANQESDFGGVHQSNDVAGGLPRSPGNTGAQNASQSTDRNGSQTDVHKSNDAAGGYPRSPGYANRLAGDSNMDDDTGFKRKP